MKRGFTILEVMLALLLVGLLAVGSMLALIPVFEAMVNVRQNAEGAQKMQFVIGRLGRELTTITNVVSGSGQSLTYDYIDQHKISHRRTLGWSGQPGAPLLLDGAVLLDDVGVFSLRYRSAPNASPQTTWAATHRELEVVIGLASLSGSYTNRVRPRNIP